MEFLLGWNFFSDVCVFKSISPKAVNFMWSNLRIEQTKKIKKECSQRDDRNNSAYESDPDFDSDKRVNLK